MVIPDFLERLGGFCHGRGLTGVSHHIAALGQFYLSDIQMIESTVSAMPRTDHSVMKTAIHLLDLGGKRLRPLCVALASRVGNGFSGAACELAVAAELIHSATLLHDDVVDVGETRRGAPTARRVYGNAAAIFAGDWLIVEALRRVRLAKVPNVLDRLLDTLHEMILAESLQLENRGRLSAGRERYFQIVEGKTASLFRWALFSGGCAGGLTEADCTALDQYGFHLGVAFQLIDDLLDLTGDESLTGKSIGIDLREGKVTYPLIVALERDPVLGRTLERLMAENDETEAPTVQEIIATLYRTNSIDDCRTMARHRAERAVQCLAHLPPNDATQALKSVAIAAVERAG